MASLICNACQIAIHSDEERAAHYRSEWHRYNVKRRCAGLASIPQHLFDSQLTALNNKKAAETAQKATLNCKTCKKTFATASAMQAHLTSKKHLKKVEKSGEDGAEEDAEEDEVDESKMTDAAATAAPKAAKASLPKSTVRVVKTEAKEDTEGMEDDDDTVEDGEEEEEGEPIPLKTCLFSPKTFNDIQSSVDYMLKQHGFFIPFIENLVDLEGLLTYLGEKIGIGHVCLWCNARFPSTQAVQNHMAAKSHCKLRLEDEDDEEELLDYYDFDLDEEEETETAATDAASSTSSSTALVVSKDDQKAPLRSGGGGASSINDAGELVLADGSIVGSRVNKHLYKQHVRPSRDLTAIAAHYKQLALTTNVKQENPRIYRKKREAFHQRRRKREDLAKGLAGNFQFHFRAQVSY